MGLIALVCTYSPDGLLADEGTESWKFRCGLPDEASRPSDDDQSLDFLAYSRPTGST